MEYKFTSERENYEVYASGSVLVAAPGHPAFPVRLANEIFRRCLAYRQTWGANGRCVLYDPCCGGAYHLTTITYFNWPYIEGIYASDIDPDALSIAARNLSLLEPTGLDQRIAELSDMAVAYGKESHTTALTNAALLKAQLMDLRGAHPIPTQLFHADATDKQALATALTHIRIDIVITDIPYGQQTEWDTKMSPDKATNPLMRMLDALLPRLNANAVVAVAAAKRDTIRHEHYQRLEKFNVGKRQIALLRPLLT